MVWRFILTAGFLLLNNHEKVLIPISRELQSNEPARKLVSNNGTLVYKMASTGNDERVFLTDDKEVFEEARRLDEELLLRIKKGIDQMELLKILENPGIGIDFKIAHLEQYELLHGKGAITKPNLKAGNLFKEFDM